MAIVSCPECGKKLKVADASIGKKVKGPCGHVFVAHGGVEAAPQPMAAVAPEKVYVGCSECGAKLKVATTSLGKKMKCPKCSATFVASLPDEEPALKAKAKANPDDDMDDLLAFAQADAATGNGEADDANPFKNEPVKSRVQRKMDEEDAAAAIMAKGKAKAKKSDDDEPIPMDKKPVRAGKDAKPVYPSRLLANILVTLMLLAFGGLVGAIFFEVNIAKQLGLPEAKGVKPKLKTQENGSKDLDTKVKELAAQNKTEMARLEGAWIVDSPDELKGKKFIFAGDKVTLPSGESASYSVEADKDPKWINLPGTGKTPAAPGIYNLDGDTLRMCTAISQKKVKKGKEVVIPGPRPSKFDAADGLLIVATREKKAEPTNSPEAKVILPKDDANFRMLSANSLKLIGLALHGYHKKHKSFPPAAMSDAAGKPLLSWRVAILPFAGPEEEALYKEFDLDQSWDSPHNKALIAKMPQVFSIPTAPTKEGATHFRTLVGPGTVLEPMKGPGGKLIGRSMLKIPDGTSNTVMVVEANEPTIWTKPDDLPYDPAGPLPKFGVAPAGFNVLLVDVTVVFVRSSVPEKVLRPYLTGNNGMPREPLDKKEPSPAEKDAAAAQIHVLTMAVQAYRVKNQEFPATLDAMLEKNDVGGPYLENKEALLDPWGKRYQYDEAGKKNEARHPDIWTVAPNNEIIGNWQKK
jgi:uncharacterized protein (TIGR03067 family)